MRQAQERSGPIHLVGYTTGAIVVFLLYLIVPLLIAVGAFRSGLVRDLWIALPVFAAGELLIFSVLARTTRRAPGEYAYQERRRSIRRQASFEVEIESAPEKQKIVDIPVRGRMANASLGGLAVLVRPGQALPDQVEITLKAHLESDMVTAKAHIISATNVVAAGNPRRLVRLRLDEMTPDDEARYLAELDRLPAAIEPGSSLRGSGETAALDQAPSLQLRASRLAQRVQQVAGLLPLGLILVVQTVGSLLLRNTAYQDEALYLYAGRQVFDHLLGSPRPLEYNARSLSGLLYVYPVLAGALDAWGGLELARLFSLFWMLCATLAVFAICRSLYGRSSALLAAALFAVQGPVLFLGHLATFDAMALALIAFSAVVALRVARAQTPWPSLAVGALLLLAVATKYAALLWAPSVLALLGWQTLRSHGWRQACVRLCIAGSLLGAVAVAALVFAPNVAASFFASTASRTVAFQDSRLHLMRRVFALCGVLLTLGLFGFLFASRRRRVLGLLLLVSALLAPAYQIYMHEFVALHKHVAYGLVFAAPLAGYIVRRLGDRRILVAVTLCLVLFSMGVEASRSLYDEWPNTSGLIQVLREQELPQARVLAEVPYEARYYLQDSKDWTWNDLWGFHYTDRSGETLRNNVAYKTALADGYFDLVVLSYGPNRETAAVAHAIDGDIRANKHYVLVGKVPYQSKFGSGDFWIWRRVGSASS